MDVTKTTAGMHKIQNVHFYVVAKVPDLIIYETARHRLKQSVLTFEALFGMKWEQAMYEGFMVMRVYADLVDNTWKGAQSMSDWTRDESTNSVALNSLRGRSQGGAV